MKENSWKQERQEPARIVAGHKMTEKAYRWLGERLEDRVRGAQGWTDNTWPIELQDHVVDWFLENRLQFVDWRAWDEFANHHASTGRWILCESDVAAQFYDAIAEATRRHESMQFPTLDAWLEAERTGQLQSKGVAGGSASFSPQVVSRLRDAKERRTWLARSCRDCGRRFSVGYRFSRVVRCEVCRAEKRAQLPNRTPSKIAPVQPQKLLPASTSSTSASEYARGREEQEAQFLRMLATESSDATLKAIAGMNLLLKDLLKKDPEQ